ncbi:hypothetical protein SDC9_148809 [bioreactor metagenome]|uniref:Uncharacterized protein n=1 Tax=bioreactor metagenome TaxID=1076179 RepID=A0A645EKE0_9ZZZZ
MYAFACQGIKINRQSGYKRLTFTSSHLGDISFVQRNSAQHLNIKMTHTQYPAGTLTDNRKGFGQNIIKCFALFEAQFKFSGLSR